MCSSDLDCDVYIEQLLAIDAACLLGCPKRLQHSVPRCFNCYPLRRHCGVGFVLQFLKILSDRHKTGAPWHRLALVDLMSVKLCPIFFQHRHVIPENATKVAIERARSRESKTSLADDRTSDPYSTPKILPRDFLYCSRSVGIKEVCFV